MIAHNNFNLDDLQKDMLDDNFIRVFQPVLLLQTFFCCSRVSIKHGFVTPHTKVRQIIFLLVWAIFVAATYHCLFISVVSFDANEIYFIITRIGMMVNNFVNIIVVFRNLFYHEDINYRVFVKLKQIDGHLNLDPIEINRWLALISKTVSLAIFTMFVFWSMVYNGLLTKEVYPSCLPIVYTGVCNHSEHAVFFMMFYYLGMRVEYLNTILQEDQRKVSLHKRIFWAVPPVPPALRGHVGHNLVQALCQILETFADIVKVYQLSIFLFLGQILCWKLMVLQCIIVAYKRDLGLEDVYSILSAVPVSVSMIGVMTFASIMTTMLTLKIKTTKKLCIHLINKKIYGEEQTRDNLKRMLILLQPKWEVSIYGVLTFDAQTPVTMFVVLATYVILLLQFTISIK